MTDYTFTQFNNQAGTGATDHALSVAQQCADTGNHTLYISTERTESEVMTKLSSSNDMLTVHNVTDFSSENIVNLLDKNTPNVVVIDRTDTVLSGIDWADIARTMGINVFGGSLSPRVA